MRRRPTRREFGVGLAAAGVIGTGLRPAVAQAAEVKVAMIAPLSGPWARQGQLMRMGADMALEEINQKGGVKALGGAKMSLVAADAGDSTEKAKNAAQRLFGAEPGSGRRHRRVAQLVHAGRDRGHRACPAALADALLFGPDHQPRASNTSSRPRRRPTGRRPRRSRRRSNLAEKVAGKRPKTVGILMDNTASPVSFAKPLREGGLEKLGLKLVVDQIFTPPLSDATPLIEKVRAAQPDFLLLPISSTPDNKLVLEKLDEFGLGKGRLPVVGNGAPFGSPELKKVIGPSSSKACCSASPTGRSKVRRHSSSSSRSAPGSRG